MSKMDSYSIQICDNNNATEETWSALPNILLWMVKDRLDFVSNVRLATVCRNWWSASSCYPKKLQTAGDRFPWIMQAGDEDGTWEFYSVSRRDKFTVHLPEFCGALMLFSKEGWLLLARTYSLGRDSIVLFNLFTKTKIEMPDLVGSYRLIYGCFSTFEGVPNCVALVVNRRNTLLRIKNLKVACPGDSLWIEHSHITQGLESFNLFASLVLRGNHVYALGSTGRMLVYNMQSRKREVVPREGLPRSNPVTPCQMVEREGEVIKYEWNGLHVSVLRLFRYNAAEVAWEKLDYEEMENTSWFLSINCLCFSVRDKGLKVYYLQQELDKSMDKSTRYFQKAYFRNIGDGSSHMLVGHSLCESAMWVDMG